MTKSTIWKLIFIFLILLASFSLVSPFEDRELGEYAESQASTNADSTIYPDHVTFSSVTNNIRAGLEEGEALDFEKLRNYGKENKAVFGPLFYPKHSKIITEFSNPFIIFRSPLSSF